MDRNNTSLVNFTSITYEPITLRAKQSTCRRREWNQGGELNIISVHCFHTGWLSIVTCYRAQITQCCFLDNPTPHFTQVFVINTSRPHNLNYSHYYYYYIGSNKHVEACPLSLSSFFVTDFIINQCTTCIKFYVWRTKLSFKQFLMC